MSDNYNILDTPVGALVFSGARVSLNGDQAIADNSPQAMSWGNTDYDTDGYWSGGAPEGLVIPATPGTAWYIFYGCVVFDSNSTGQRQVSMTKNGGTFGGDPLNLQIANSAIGNGMVFCTSPLAAVAGDAFKIIVYQNSGGNLNVIASGGNTRFGVYRAFA